MNSNEWRDKFLAEPQLEVYERAVELVKADVTRFSCCAIYNAVREFAKRDLDCAPWLHVTQVEGRYSNQFKEMWCAGASPFWWCSINYLHMGWKIRALNFFKKMCLEEKTDNYDPAEDKDNIKEWIILMWQSKEDQPIKVTELAVSRAIRKMHFIKTGIPLKTINSAKVSRLVSELNME